MTCQECELTLDAATQETQRHLGHCAACRALAEEIRANSEIFHAMASDPMPSVRHAVIAKIAAQSARKNILRWGWALAATAAIALAALLAIPREQKLPPVHLALAPMKFDIPAIAPKPKPVAPAKPLMVKMLTDDPNVVIYWEIDSEGDNQ
jgi:hypothetical protein